MRAFDLDGVPDDVTSVSRRLSRDERIAAFIASVQSLPTVDRELVELRGLQGLAWDDVARTLDLSAPAARQRWSRLVRRLREAGIPSGIESHDWD